VPPADSAAAVAGLAQGDIVTAVDASPVRSWQDLRWKLLRASGSDAVLVAVDRPGGVHTERRLSIASVSPDDWEGNFMGVLGLKLDLGAPLVRDVITGKPAEAAGLKPGDAIVAINGEPMRSPSDVAAATNARPGERVRFTIRRDGKPFEIELTPEATEQNGRKVGIAGMRLAIDPAAAADLNLTVRYGPLEAVGQATVRTWELSVFTVRMLGRIIAGSASLKNISGPLTMADYAGQSAQAGLLTFVGYLALISISLGVLNLLPVPLLDGGHLLYYLVEIFKGSPVSDRALEVGQRIGMAVLAMLMALALFNDLTRLL
jgi:regulator of sigma E protease